MEKKIPLPKIPQRVVLFSFVVMPKYQDDGEHDFRERITGGSFTDSVVVLCNARLSLTKLVSGVTERYIPKKYRENYVLKPLNISNMTSHGSVWMKFYHDLDSIVDLTTPLKAEAQAEEVTEEKEL
jgi:hypothetical protein